MTAMKDKKILGVILAAGRGTRMEPFSAKYPKAILPICNKSLIRYQIEYMESIGIKDIIIVIGHLGFEIVKSFTNDAMAGVNLQYIEQDETLGIAHAVGKLEPYVSDPFLLFLGDIFFIAADLPSMIKSLFDDGAGAVLAVKEEKDKEAIKRNFSVILNESGFVKRVIEKPRYIPNNLKGCGLYLFDLTIFDAIRRTPRTAMRDEYEITDSIQILIEDGVSVKAAPAIKWDMNLTYPHDLLRCNLRQLELSGERVKISNNSRKHPEAKIINSVIGENVLIKNPIEIINSVIFPETVVVSEKKLDSVILTPENIIDCKPWL